MITRLIEVSDQMNWAKLLVGVFDATDLAQRSKVDKTGPLLQAVEGRRRAKTGDAHRKWLVHDLQTEEGGLFLPSREPGAAKADLDQHALWVCPLFEPFLEWLYQRCSDPAALHAYALAPLIGPRFLEGLPDLIELPPNESPKLQGYRRSGEIDGIAVLRQALIETLRACQRLPETVVQMRVWITDVLPAPDAALLSTFLASLPSHEATRWIGALMADSGRFVTVGTVAGGIALAPR